ncbi:MAG: Ig-like domain-containing protein [Theionarchaea archaeon]|nr:Ig-like domain-containing protein [Theionarchaea archaeon]
MKVLKATMIILLIAGFLCPVTAANLTVRVFDIEGNPLEGATVRVAYDEQETNSEGIAVIDIPQQYNVPISLLVTREGYENYAAVLNPPYPTSLEVVLYSSEKGFIQGTVYFDTTDNPAGAGYIIEFYDALLNNKIGTAVTDDTSRFEFEVSIDRSCFLILPEYPEQRFEAKPGEDIDVLIKTKERPKASLLFQSGIKFSPGSVIIVGEEAHQMDGITALQVRNALLTWIGEADPRVSAKVPSFKDRYLEIGDTILDQLETVDVVTDYLNLEKTGFFTVLIGGPEVNAALLRYNQSLSTRFIEDRTLEDKWFIQEPGGFSYKDSEYGIIALIPMYDQLDDSAIYNITGGDKRLCMLVVAGNAREGTYAAGLKLKDILKTGSEGQQLLNELDKLLIWMFLGEKQIIQPVTIVVRYVDESTANIVDVLIG